MQSDVPVLLWKASIWASPRCLRRLLKRRWTYRAARLHLSGRLRKAGPPFTAFVAVLRKTRRVADDSALALNAAWWADGLVSRASVRFGCSVFPRRWPVTVTPATPIPAPKAHSPAQAAEPHGAVDPTDCANPRCPQCSHRHIWYSDLMPSREGVQVYDWCVRCSRTRDDQMR